MTLTFNYNDYPIRKAQDDSIHINERGLIRLVGHEGMGHALTKVITEGRNDLPFFLSESSNRTIASEESVTQFYERVVFDDLSRSRRTQKALLIDHIFPQIYQDQQDTQAITEYQRNLFALSWLFLFNSSC